MMFGKFIDSSTVTGTQIRLDNEQWLRGRNFANTGDLNILRINSSNQIEFKQIPYVEGQGRLALYSEIDGVISFVEYLYGQLSEVTEDISIIQSDIVTIQGEIDALQSETGDFALKDLSNLTATSIPNSINLESLSSFFTVKTKNQLSTESGDIALNSGNTASSYKSGYVLVSSGTNNSANAATSSTMSTGLLLLYTGDISGVQGTSGSIEMITGYVLSNNFIGNTGSINIESGWVQGTSCAGNTGTTTISTGRIFHATSNGDTGLVSVSSGNNAGPGNSGSVNISSGSVSSGNSGDVNISTGLATSGVRGGIEINGQNTTVYLRNYDVTGNNSLFRITNSSPGIGQMQFLTYARGNDTLGIRIFDSASISGFSIDGWGRSNQNGGPFNFMSTKAYPNVDGTLTGGDFNIVSASTDYIDPALGLNASVNSGNVNISSANGYITGTNTDANSGNINLTTGNAQGAGTRGFISLDGDYVTASSTQIKDVADPTDPQDALTLNYFNNNIPSVVEFDFYPLQAYNTYATIYSNGSAGVLDPVTPTNPRAGWYFKNSSGSPEKINWYFFDGTLVSCQLQNFSAFAVVTFDSIASLPFFGFYTFPTGSGDIIPGFAHSRVVYSTPYVPSAVTGTKYLIYFGNDPEVFPYLPRIQLTYNAAASGGDQGPTELVSTCAFSSDSGASANNVQVMVENLGLNLSNFKAYFDLLIFPVFEESQNYYGSFYSSQTQTNPVPDIARAMTFNNTDEANGVSIVSNSRITFATAGLYNIQFSSQFSNSNGSKQEVDIWLAKNGVNIPYTNSQEQISGQIDTISAWNFFVRVIAGQYVELYWSSPSTDVSILYSGSKTGPNRPETPSIILTVNKIIS